MSNTNPAPLPKGSAARYGCYVAIATGVILFGTGADLLVATDKPLPLSVALIVVGALDALLGWLAVRRNRAAWAFCVATNTTLAVSFFFGSTKLRDELGVPLVVGLVPAVVLGVAAVLLAVSVDDYER